jgi:hypothetical protein
MQVAGKQSEIQNLYNITLGDAWKYTAGTVSSQSNKIL